jgi:glycosyltransferase involved in cell wall biosynthesis
MGEMPPNVNYYGGEKYDLLPRWLVAMDVGLCLYHPGPADHSTPLKLFDYMASGLTVVSNDQPFVRELFNQLGQPDLIAPPRDADALARILLSLASDRDRVRQLGQAGRRLVVGYYNWRRAVADTFEEIALLMREKKK